MEVSRYPFNLQSGWLPRYDSSAIRIFFESLVAAVRRPYAGSIEELDKFLATNEVVKYLLDDACRQNLNMIEAHQSSASAPIPRIPDKETLLHAFNEILTQAPQFIDNELVGLPFSAVMVGIDPTLGGTALLRLPMFNERMSAILQEWSHFLDAPESNTGFRVEGEQWLSEAAKQQYQFDLWKKDSEQLPYWESWNSFFTRQFKDPAKERPIAAADSNQVAICPNDGSLFCWEADVADSDVFWFKDMPYSLRDILSSPLEDQQAVIDQYGLVDIFKGGYVFQTYLNPYNFHRWWVPVNGRVMFDPITIPGCFFSKLVIPDFGGATTASTPYLAEVNARGLIVFETEDYGRVCCIPLGMSEVSSVVFDQQMRCGATVRKGDEMGTFNYGGSSFVVIYEKLPNKELIFMNEDGVHYPNHPVLPTGSAGTGGNVTRIGSQIGVWYSR